MSSCRESLRYLGRFVRPGIPNSLPDSFESRGHMGSAAVGSRRSASKDTGLSPYYQAVRRLSKTDELDPAAWPRTGGCHCLNGRELRNPGSGPLDGPYGGTRTGTPL